VRRGRPCARRRHLRAGLPWASRHGPVAEARAATEDEPESRRTSSRCPSEPGAAHCSRRHRRPTASRLGASHFWPPWARRRRPDRGGDPWPRRARCRWEHEARPGQRALPRPTSGRLSEPWSDGAVSAGHEPVLRRLLDCHGSWFSGSMPMDQDLRSAAPRLGQHLAAPLDQSPHPATEPPEGTDRRRHVGSRPRPFNALLTDLGHLHIV